MGRRGVTFAVIGDLKTGMRSQENQPLAAIGMQVTLLLTVVIASALALAAPVSAASTARPNILYITADDLGWKDLGYHGGGVQTPNLDRLARDGARLEQFYVQPTSTQTRAAFLTGRYPMRYGLQTMQIQSSSQFGLPADERTLTSALQQAGYRTALIGKWHLGQNKDYWPQRRGYDYFYGHLAGEIDYFKKTNRQGELDWHRNDKLVKEEGYAIALLAKDAASVIAKHDPSVPLFLYLSFAAPQAPLEAPKELTARYRDLKTEEERAYRAMIGAVDNAIGTTLAALEARGMLANTLVIFNAATGGALPSKYPLGDGDTQRSVANNGPYRGGRGGLYDGGMRVAALAYWPGKVQPAVVTELMHVTDLYPTILGLAGANPTQPRPIDGLDQWPTLSEGQASPRKEMLLNVEEFRGAIRAGDWKLIVYATLPGRVELYNLKADPSEEDNQAEREPERLQAMHKRLVEYAWEMAPAKYLDELGKPHKAEVPIFWGDNPVRP